MKAEEKYTGQYAKIQKELLILKGKLEKHKDAFGQNGKNWGYVGDLVHVHKELKDINLFLN
jgi:hypothetical protein